MGFKQTSNNAPSFTEVFTELRSSRARNEFLEQIDKLIDWRPFKTLINKKLNKRAEAKGEPTYVDSRTKCNREEERGEKFERGDVVMFLPGSVVE